MGKQSRFLNLPYLSNTIIIKMKAMALKITRGPYPFEYFAKKNITTDTVDYKLNLSQFYHSLRYLNLQKAKKLHSGDRSITQKLIIGLSLMNELFIGATVVTKYPAKLVENLIEKATISDNNMTFYFDEAYSRFDLTGKYSSGIVQGKAASFFLRYSMLTKDEKYMELAKKCLLTGLTPTDEGGVMRSLSNDQIWIEEYPSPKPSMVLNGFLFYIIGLAEYLSVKEDKILILHFEKCIQSVVAWMPKYKLNNGLLYSMYRWNLCNVHYTGIMKYQFEHLFKLTGIPIFEEFATFTDELTDWPTFNKLIDSTIQ